MILLRIIITEPPAFEKHCPYRSHLSQRLLISFVNLVRSRFVPPSLCAITCSRRRPAICRRSKMLFARRWRAFGAILTGCGCAVHCPASRSNAHPVYGPYVARFIHGNAPLWSASYFVATTGSVSLETVKSYIESQRTNEHKRKYEMRSRYWQGKGRNKSPRPKDNA